MLLFPKYFPTVENDVCLGVACDPVLDRIGYFDKAISYLFTWYFRLDGAMPIIIMS